MIIGRKNRRKRPNITKPLCIYGRLSRKNNSVAYCKLHKCFLEPKDIAEKKYKKEEIKKAKQRRQEGSTLEEIIRLSNKEYISVEEIKDIINKKDEFIEESIKVTFYKNEIDEYFENKKTENQIKKYIFEILEKVKIS